MTQYRTHLSCR